MKQLNKIKKLIVLLWLALWGGCLCAQEISDYNPYRQQQKEREEYLQTGREMYQDLMSRSCDQVFMNNLLEEYSKNKNNPYGKDLFYDIGRMNCDTVVPFLHHLLLTDANEEVRCDALLLLGWHRPQELVPFFLEYVKRDISPKEKIAVASVLCVMEHFDKALPVLDENCMKMEEMHQNCITSYYKIGNNESARKFFSKFLDNEFYKLSVAYYLAETGIYDQSLPIFRETIEKYEKNEPFKDYFGNDSVSRICVALKGLAMVGTKEAISLIGSQCQNTNSNIAKYATGILNNLKKGGSEK
jgi:tetratricopeptide (TPR) repeat protein